MYLKYNQLRQYALLMRLDKPIGVLLLLWPTLWALWLAGGGQPQMKIVAIFVLGVIIMRSAGCVVNDFADKKFDGHVNRTKNRPFALGAVSAKEALSLAGLLLLMAFGLVLFCNRLTIYLSFVGAFIACVYPYLKRVTHLPQLGLGVAFSWGVPMAFAAVTNHVPAAAWGLFVTAAIWPVIYDTQYAMTDRQDDLKIGIKSTAILLANWDRLVIALLQLGFVFLLILQKRSFHLADSFYVVCLIVALLFVYQQWLMRNRDSLQCFQAFLNNNWVGAVIFIGVFLAL